MKLYDGIKRTIAVGVMAASLTGLAGIVDAEEKKFTPVKVNAIQKNVGDTLVYVSLYQTDKPNSSGIYPVQVKLYFGKRMDNMLISETKESETFNSTSDRCWGLGTYKKSQNNSVVIELFDSACADKNSEEVIKAKYERIGQGDFQKKR
jgi:hypothetical protein